MSIGYIIITLGEESRQQLVTTTHRLAKEAGLIEVPCVEFVDGRTPEKLNAALALSEFKINSDGGFHNGEVGLWLSTINALKAIASGEHEYVVVFDDDAVILPSFETMLPWVLRELPADADFFAVAVPENQRQDYYYHRAFTENGSWFLISQDRHPKEGSPHYIPGNSLVCKVYQGYRTVATMYSKSGAQRILDILERTGLYTPIDLFLFENHHANLLNGYTFLPDVTDAVTHKETGSTVRGTGMLND